MQILGVTGGDIVSELRGVAVELCVLGVDAAICGVLWTAIHAWERAISRIRDAPVFDVDLQLPERLRPTGQLRYAGVRGVVQPTGRAIKSQWDPDVSGVIQRLSLSEHRVNRTTGFWSEQLRVLRDTTNTVPFRIESGRGGGLNVLVDDAKRLWHVDLQTVHDQYVPAETSLAQSVWQWMVGERRRGLQDVEEMLLCGTDVTGYGKLLLTDDGVRLCPPDASDLPFVLSSQSEASLVRQFESDRDAVWWLAAVLSAVGAGYSVWVGWRLWRGLRQRRSRRSLMLQWDSIRTERRRRERDGAPVPEPVQCVVCLTNPREVVLSPCQHVCLCVDCEEQLTRRQCPVCRQDVQRVLPAYIS